MMTKLYCPECSAYLEGGDGENKDCLCGWKQPRDNRMTLARVMNYSDLFSDEKDNENNE